MSDNVQPDGRHKLAGLNDSAIQRARAHKNPKRHAWNGRHINTKPKGANK